MSALGTGAAFASLRPALQRLTFFARPSRCRGVRFPRPGPPCALSPLRSRRTSSGTVWFSFRSVLGFDRFNRKGIIRWFPSGSLSGGSLYLIGGGIRGWLITRGDGNQEGSIF